MGEIWVLASDYDSKLCFYSASSLSNIVKVDICLVSYPETSVSAEGLGGP